MIKDKVDKQEIYQLKEDLKEIKEKWKKTADEQENKIQEITSTKADGTSWEDIMSKEKETKNVEDTIGERLKEKMMRKEQEETGWKYYCLCHQRGQRCKPSGKMNRR